MKLLSALSLFGLASVSLAQVYSGTISWTLTPTTSSCTGAQTFSQAGTLTFGPPATDGTYVESNPANLILQSADASLSLYSAIVVGDVNLLEQYWSYTSDSTGAISGTLIDTGESIAAAPNAFIVNVPIIPYQCDGSTIPNYELMGLGSTMSGSMSSIPSLTVMGATVDEAYTFEIQFS